MPNTSDLSAKRNKRRRKAVSRGESMKAEYDFSKAERGKFYSPAADFSFPVYLDPDISDFLDRLAKQKRVDVQDLVNEWLRADVKLIRSIR